MDVVFKWISRPENARKRFTNIWKDKELLVKNLGTPGLRRRQPSMLRGSVAALNQQLQCQIRAVDLRVTIHPQDQGQLVVTLVLPVVVARPGPVLLIQRQCRVAAGVPIKIHTTTATTTTQRHVDFEVTTSSAREVERATMITRAAF